MFKKRENVFEVEEGKFFSPKFDVNGLIPVTTTDSGSGELLMHGYMNAEAIKKTIETKEAHYWSRSKKALWHKGETSGFVQKVIDLRIDDDQDALWMSVDIGNGASCHVGYKSCFYRSIPLGPIKNIEEIKLDFKEKKKKFDPEKFYLEGLKIKPNHNGINEYLGELYVQTNQIDKANERLAVLKNCNCDEYQELELIIKNKGVKIY